MVTARCHDCHQDYTVSDEYRGMLVKCPRGHAVHVPAIGMVIAGVIAGRLAARWATPVGIAFYVLAIVTFLGGLFAAFMVGSVFAGGGFMVFCTGLVGAMFSLATGMMLHMLGALVVGQRAQ